MLNELKDLVGEVSVFNASNPLTATIFTPEETANIADITLNPEVNSSPCRSVTCGMYSVNSVKT